MSSHRRRSRRGRPPVSRSAPRRSAYANVLLIAVVLLIIAFAGFLSYLKQHNRGAAGADTPGAPVPTAVAATAAPPAGGAVAPKYDFYQDQTPANAIRSAAEAGTAAAADAGTDAAAAASSGDAAPTITLLSPNARGGSGDGPRAAADAAPLSGYVVQAGAFSQYADADRLSARLLLLGMRPRIERGVVDDNEIHRVRIGPFATLDEAKALQRTLDRNRISSYVLQLK